MIQNLPCAHNVHKRTIVFLSIATSLRYTANNATMRLQFPENACKCPPAHYLGTVFLEHNDSLLPIIGQCSGVYLPHGFTRRYSVCIIQ